MNQVLLAVGFFVAVCAGAALLITVVDYFVEWMTRRSAGADVDEVFRRDHAREVMRGWTDD